MNRDIFNEENVDAFESSSSSVYSDYQDALDKIVVLEQERDLYKDLLIEVVEAESPEDVEDIINNIKEIVFTEYEPY